MANRKQLRRLKEGVEGWNAWRQENPDVRIDLRRANLKGRSLLNVDLSAADIRGTNFSKGNLTGANLKGVRAGLEESSWLLLLGLLGVFLAGIHASSHGYSIDPIISESSIAKTVSGWVSTLGVAALYILFLLRGINVTVGIGAVIVTVTGVSAIALRLTGAIAGVGVFGIPLSLANGIAGAFVGTLAVAITGVVEESIVPVVVASVFGIYFVIAPLGVEVIDYGIKTIIVGSVAVVYMMLHVYMGRRAVAGDKKYAMIYACAIAVATIGGTQFRKTNLTDADFFEADLKNTDFRNAILIRTHLHCSKSLDRSRCGGTILDNASVRALAVTHKGEGQSYAGQNLTGINLRGADLSNAELLEADISDATLEGAFLEGANLTKVRAFRTCFQQATLTAACLEAWDIDSTTQLDGVICDHVYLLNNQQERRPNSGNFAPGEFTKLFE